jgi:pyruvate formate lyase activating enzyme
MGFSRRQFLKRGLAFTLGLKPFLGAAGWGLISPGDAAAYSPQKAMYFTKLDDTSVRCDLCPHACMLNEGQRGFCRVRESRGGQLYSLVYDLPCSIHVDPIEKKPMYHMLPASRSFSLATAGCNSRCKYCQNWQISQYGPEHTVNTRITRHRIVEKALASGCRSIAYTYSEPNVFFEYGIDTAKLAKARGIKNIWVTGGLINQAPLRELAKYVDAANIDFKGFDDSFLREVCGQNLKTITETIKTSRSSGMWIELTNLIVPTLNDSPMMIKGMAQWIRDNVGDQTPLHFSRFWPMHKLKNLPPTPVSTLEKAREIAMAVGLKYVYTGNVPGHEGNNTYCASCGKMIIGRKGYLITHLKMSKAACGYCGHIIPGIWE